jgi:hypothetical protein
MRSGTLNAGSSLGSEQTLHTPTDIFKCRSFGEVGWRLVGVRVPQNDDLPHGGGLEMFFLSGKNQARLREAENARRNRAEIVKARSTGTRRDLIKAGIYTAGGLLVPIHGLSPFAKSAFGAVPTGTPLSPFPRRDARGSIIDRAFTQPLLRLHNLTRQPLTRVGAGSNSELVWPAAVAEPNSLRRANTSRIRHTVNLANATNTGNVSVRRERPSRTSDGTSWSMAPRGRTEPERYPTPCRPWAS